MDTEMSINKLGIGYFYLSLTIPRKVGLCHLPFGSFTYSLYALANANALDWLGVVHFSFGGWDVRRYSEI